MTWKSSETCNNCGASYEIDIWDLGHKDSDRIICECCGNEIKKWKNEARSYSIARMVAPGNMRLKYNEWEKYKGKKLKFTKGAVQIEGILKGLGESVIATSSGEAVNPWLIITENGECEIHPEDNWIICMGK
jgi:hypothetical protein